MGTDYTYRYASGSRLDASGLLLATSGGLARPVDARRAPERAPASPVFFRGGAHRPDLVAGGLLAVAEVARTRWFQPTDVAVRDPVVSCDGEVVRFESFSDCCGVHARLDLLPDLLDGEVLARGATNVDVGEPLRRSLARVGPRDLLHLSVGVDELAVTTGDGAVVERKVALPPRWLRGFAEVQALSVPMEPRVELSGPAAIAFLAQHATGSRAVGAGWVVPAGAGLRQTSRPASGALCLSGPQRLAPLKRLVRHATALRGYGPCVDATSAPVASTWELELPGARLLITLSPEVQRGFSGEGAVLDPLVRAGDALDDVVDTVRGYLADTPSADVDDLAEATELPPARVRAALTALAASGRVGYDVTSARWFERELPFVERAVERQNPRLKAARALVESGGVRLLRADDPTGALAEVTREGRLNRVREGDGRLSCTCRWFATHRHGRGPCAHVLAVQLARGGR